MGPDLQEAIRGRALTQFRDAALEAEYRDYLLDSRRTLIRNCLFIALGIFVVLEPLASIWAPAPVPAVDAWSRWLVDVPSILFALWALQYSENRTLIQTALLVSLGAVLASNAMSLWVALPELRPFYLVAGIQIMLFGFMLIGLRFRQAFIGISLVLGAAALVSSVLAVAGDRWADFRGTYAMLALVYLGLAFSAYFLDLSARNVFLLNRRVAQTHARQLELERERSNWLRVGNDYLNHEIKNAMLGISSSLSLLQRRNRDEELSDYISRAGQSTAFMKRLLGEVGASTSLEAALSSLQPERVDLASLLRAKLDDYREIYPGREFELSACDSALVDCDADRIVQALDKLVDNAVAHADSAFPIQLHLEAPASDVILDVSNIGEPLVDAGPELFDPFVTGRSRTADGGFGLGLYVVKRIVEAHGGSVSCTPLHDPDGAAFRIALPAAADHPLMAPPRSPPSDSHGRARS